jgi:hypothetical protein
MGFVASFIACGIRHVHEIALQWPEKMGYTIYTTSQKLQLCFMNIKSAVLAT